MRKKIWKKKTFSFKRKVKNHRYEYIKFIMKIFAIVLELILYTIKFNIKNDLGDLSDSGDLDKFINSTKPKYFTCFAAMAKTENRYIRQTVEHYLKLGVDKFYFGDDNEPNTERIADVLQDYIDKGIVEVKLIRELNWEQMDYYEYELRHLYNVCEWILYFDIDEFLEFQDKNMTIKDYLTLDGFDKCEVVKIHWIVYCDNDLVHYENKPLEERFPKPSPKNFGNNFHKSIVRVKNYNTTMWVDSPHQPNETYTYSCDATGRYYKRPRGILGTPNYKYCYLKHYNMKTAEEYLVKLTRGHIKQHKYSPEELLHKMDKFFACNKVTEEKLSMFEKTLNMTFPKYHRYINK